MAAIGATLVSPLHALTNSDFEHASKGKKAKNIIFMVSDGMSSGTLNMADIFLNRKYNQIGRAHV